MSFDLATTNNFLQAHNLLEAPQILLPRDASKRQYLRLAGTGKILMYSELSDKPDQFEKLSDLLNSLELSAPKFYAKDVPNNLYLLEDFGDNTYRKALSLFDEEELYSLAVRTLIHIKNHVTTTTDFLKTYTPDVVVNEALLFLDWYGDGFSNQACTDFEGIFYEIMGTFDVPHTLMLRDYHIDNLFYLDQRGGVAKCGLIDFQDAMFGPVGYDLVSLTYDVRRDLSTELREKLLIMYLGSFETALHESIKECCDKMNLARHFRIFGAFSRLAKRDGKVAYLIHFPRMFRHITELFQKPQFNKLKGWCEAHGII